MAGGARSSRAQAKGGVLNENSLKAIAELIKTGKAKNIIVMTGAGISTAAGIPDFRTKGTGLYDNLQKFKLPYPEAIFDVDYFVERPEPFYALAKEIYPGKYYPTKTHYFIRLLKEKGVLLRNFTQNIDTLERLAGLEDEYIVEAHGSFATASCIDCNQKADTTELKKKIALAQVARCEECEGLIKPDITFFGENLPARFFQQLDDFDSTDLLIVIGTSLQVQPFASLIDRVQEHVPRLLINREVAGAYNSKSRGFDFKWKHGKNRDVLHLGDSDKGVEELAELLGWKDELDNMFRKGNEKLKAQWAVEDKLLAAVEEAAEGEPTQKEADKQVDELAEELEKRLHVPANREESESRLKEKEADTAETTREKQDSNNKSSKV